MKKQNYPTRQRRIGFTLSLACLLATGFTAKAAVVWKWNLPSTTNSSGVWTTASNWVPSEATTDTYPDAIDAIADLYIPYDAGTNRVISLSGTRTLGSLTIGDATPSPASPTKLQFGGGGASNTLIMSGTNGASITKQSSSTVEMYRTTRFASNTVITSNGGVLNFGTTDGGTSKITGTGNLSIEGSGGLTVFSAAGLSSADFSTAYTGNITVQNGGRLRINNTLQANTDGGPIGTLTVANTGTLSGAGTVSRATTIQSGGTLAPTSNVTTTAGGITTISTTQGGAAVMVYTAGLTMQTGSNFGFDLYSNTTSNRGATGGFDGINVTGGALTIAQGVVFNLTFNGTASTVDFTNAFWDTNQQWLIFDNTNAPTIPLSGNIFTLGTISTDANGNSFSVTGGAFAFLKSGDDIYLTYSTIPEPSIWLLLGAGLTWLLICRRRPRQSARSGI